MAEAKSKPAVGARGRGQADRGTGIAALDRTGSLRACLRAHVLGLVALLTWASGALAQQAVEQSIQGLAGVQTAAPGDEIQIYAVELRDDTNDGRASQLGTNGAGTGLFINIDDLGAATGLVAGDFTDLRLYRSADNTLDGGDVLLASAAPVVIGGSTLLDVSTIYPDGDPNRAIPQTPAAPAFFIISARIAAAATAGHAFRLGTNANPPGHIELRETGGGPATNYTVALTTAIGSQLVAADANRVEIGVTSTSYIPIPFRSKGLLVLSMFAYAIWRLQQRRRA